MKRNIFLGFLLASLLSFTSSVPVVRAGVPSTFGHDAERAGKDLHSHVGIGETDISYERDHSEEDVEDIVSSIRDAPMRSKPTKYGSTSSPSSTYGNRRTKRKEGQSDAYPAICQCRALRGDKNAVCYDMNNQRQSYGRCRKRKCGRKYECVPGGGKGLKTCIRRFARFETKLRRNEKGVALCNKFKMKKPKVFYTLYQ